MEKKAVNNKKSSRGTRKGFGVKGTRAWIVGELPADKSSMFTPWVIFITATIDIFLIFS